MRSMAIINSTAASYLNPAGRITQIDKSAVIIDSIDVKSASDVSHEHPSPGIVLLCRSLWRHHGGGPQHSLRNSTTSSQRPGCATRGLPWRNPFPAPALYADCRRREIVPLRRAFLFEPR